ncbi:hypothetical protein E1301_Tti020616 [Triplophysa tibetana]|uniref:Uncharacterized protein n=1 Tax=Triplophysa tibetana TaxID=1572043 RepID=A0A5A9NZ13_9TELE|nr:hypothetical protein E1301_Tti020616 [Triplophysa tibetana]
MESVRQTVLSLWHFSPTPKSEAGGVKQTCIGMENQDLVNHHRRKYKSSPFWTGVCAHDLMLSGAADDLKVLALRDLPADTVWGPFSGSVQSEEPTEVNEECINVGDEVGTIHGDVCAE